MRVQGCRTELFCAEQNWTLDPNKFSSQTNVDSCCNYYNSWATQAFSMKITSCWSVITIWWIYICWTVFVTRNNGSVTNAGNIISQTRCATNHYTSKISHLIHYSIDHSPQIVDILQEYDIFYKLFCGQSVIILDYSCVCYTKLGQVISGKTSIVYLATICNNIGRFFGNHLAALFLTNSKVSDLEG